jgi:hypothetical protein
MSPVPDSFFLKPDSSLWLFFIDHELMDSAEDSPELLIVFLFKLPKFAGEVFVCRKNFSQLHECPHDFNIHPNSATTVQDTGKHCHALFGESIR